MGQIVKNQKVELIAIKLPSITLTVFAVLTLLALTNNQIGSFIFMDKLILFIAALLPFVCITGAIVSVVAMFKTKTRKTAVSAVILNITLIIIMIFVSKPFIVEFKLAFTGI